MLLKLEIHRTNFIILDCRSLQKQKGPRQRLETQGQTSGFCVGRIFRSQRDSFMVIESSNIQVLICKEVLKLFFLLWYRGWIEKKEIHPFGDPRIDVDMLQQAKKTKKSYRIKEVKNGYIYACKLKNIDPLPQLQSVFKR